MEITNTGLIRRVDDLGRVVIPKELRKALLIEDGDPMEIYMTDDGKGVVFRRHDILPIVDQFLSLAKSLSDTGKYDLELRIRGLLREYKEAIGLAAGPEVKK